MKMFFFSSEWYSIALKKHSSKTYYKWSSRRPRSSLKKGNDINEWLSSQFSKTGNSWDHYILYNDEIPEEQYVVHDLKRHNHSGHCKGILVWNSKKIGFCLHSVPKFPKEIYFSSKKILPLIPESQCIYGQSFIYIEMSIEYLEMILHGIMVMQSSIYSSSINLQKLLSVSLPATFQFHSSLGDFFFKSNVWHYDIYEDHCTSYTQNECCVPSQNVVVHCKSQTWIRGQQINSNHVTNLSSISFDDEIQNSTQDHSKWAISETFTHRILYCLPMSKNIYRVCLTDNNRMQSQKNRGGSLIMVHHPKLWKAFSKLIN
jgi:hypothetical protein